MIWKFGKKKEIKFLRRKNEQFFRTIEELIDTGVDFEVQLWTHGGLTLWVDGKKSTVLRYGYYDLFVVNFYDELAYDRSMTIPAPILHDNNSRGARLFKQWLQDNLDKVVLCDRSQYERFGHRKPILL